MPVLADLPYVYQLYRDVFNSLDMQSRLWSVQFDLTGLAQCAGKGPNPEPYPVRVPDLYVWSSWKKFSLQLEGEGKTGDGFRSAAMARYIQIAQEYLRMLGFYPPRRSGAEPA